MRYSPFIDAHCDGVSFVGKVFVVIGGTIIKTNSMLNFSLLKVKLVFFKIRVCDYIKTVSSSSFNTYFWVCLYHCFFISYFFLLNSILNGKFLVIISNLSMEFTIVLIVSLVFFCVCFYVAGLLCYEIMLQKVCNIIKKIVITMLIVIIFYGLVYLVFKLELVEYLEMIFSSGILGLVYILFGYYILVKAKDVQGFFNIILVITTNILFCTLLMLLGSILVGDFLDFLSLLVTINNDPISIILKCEEFFTNEILDELYRENKVINKENFKVSNLNWAMDKLSYTVVNLLCKFWFLDVIINPENYFYFPSYFQMSSITLPRGFSLSTVHPVEWLYPYASPYSTLPILPHDLEVAMAVREELLWSEIIPSLTPELGSVEVGRVLTVLVEHFRTYWSLHPWYGGLYDVFTEYLGDYNRRQRLLESYENELDLLREILEHNGDLLEEEGLLSPYSESEYISSDESGSDSDDN